MMAKYGVNFDTNFYVEVEAEDEDKAIEIATAKRDFAFESAIHNEEATEMG